MKTDSMNLKTPFKNDWSIQITFGKLSKENKQEEFEEAHPGFISLTNMKNYHRDFISTCRALDALPVKGDVIVIGEGGLDTIYERWFSEKERTINFFII